MPGASPLNTTCHRRDLNCRLCVYNLDGKMDYLHLCWLQSGLRWLSWENWKENVKCHAGAETRLCDRYHRKHKWKVWHLKLITLTLKLSRCLDIYFSDYTTLPLQWNKPEQNLEELKDPPSPNCWDSFLSGAGLNELDLNLASRWLLKPLIKCSW